MFIITNEILIISQDITNLDEMSSMFINMKHDLRRLHATYEVTKMQLVVIRRMMRIMKNEKNEEIRNLREQLKNLQYHSCSQLMSFYSLVILYSSFDE